MIKLNTVYTNFTGTKLVRTVDTYRDRKTNTMKVLLADLRPPGGWFNMSQSEFNQNFTEKLETPLPPERKRETDPYYKHHRDQAENPYSVLGKM